MVTSNELLFFLIQAVFLSKRRDFSLVDLNFVFHEMKLELFRSIYFNFSMQLPKNSSMLCMFSELEFRPVNNTLFNMLHDKLK